MPMGNNRPLTVLSRNISGHHCFLPVSFSGLLRQLFNLARVSIKKRPTLVHIALAPNRCIPYVLNL